MQSENLLLNPHLSVCSHTEKAIIIIVWCTCECDNVFIWHSQEGELKSAPSTSSPAPRKLFVAVGETRLNSTRAKADGRRSERSHGRLEVQRADRLRVERGVAR